MDIGAPELLMAFYGRILPVTAIGLGVCHMRAEPEIAIGVLAAVFLLYAVSFALGLSMLRSQ